ncbi:Methyltransferase type 11 [Thiocapsa marina 5811]|uniref:Methyltransferase type 11 n=2 Tax=Thiocapsa marina TaxID=244573 RepID=F9UEY0_9GAMM|nr:Methyltransferase type 11 [Thiocapsa marina 5811]
MRRHLKPASAKLRRERIFPLLHPLAPRFECPLCGYRGPFRTVTPPTGRRKHAQCPCCGAFERHRLQCWCLHQLFDLHDFSRMRLLHFAPETHLRKLLEPRVARYETADLYADDVDYCVDLQALPFPDAGYDFVYASHVLEHVPDDGRALAEIRRILAPGGMAILPVPIVADRTVEYPAPNPYESDHVRAPGYDYFERYRMHFARVDCIDSSKAPERYQTYVYEDRTGWPNEQSPLRPAMSGERHRDIVPLCYVHEEGGR